MICFIVVLTHKTWNYDQTCEGRSYNCESDDDCEIFGCSFLSLLNKYYEVHGMGLLGSVMHMM